MISNNMLRKYQPQSSLSSIGGYIPIRNDATILSIAERNLLLSTSITVPKQQQQQQNTTSINNNNNNNNEYIHSMRVDGRKCTERRPISIQLHRHHHHHHHDYSMIEPPNCTTGNHSSTSTSSTTTTTTATVTLGAGTKVTCTVTSEIVAPLIDRPNDGILSFTVDISPSASTNYRYTTPASTYNNIIGSSSNNINNNLPNGDKYQKIQSNHILRILERCFVQPGGAIDTEALCIIPNAYVWKIHCTCTILDDSGNILDATILACIAAIRHYRQPIVELINNNIASTENTTTPNITATPIIIPSHIKEPTPLPLLHTPIAITFIFMINNNTTTKSSSSSSISNVPKMGIVIDPTFREEICSSGRMTIGMNIYKEICFMDVITGYNCELQLSDLQYCYTIATATEHITTINQILESSLLQADVDDHNQRLMQFKQQQQLLLPLPPQPGNDTILSPDHVEDDLNNNNNNNNIEHPYMTSADKEEEEEDIVYRRRALDFTIGHVASKVRENNYNDVKVNKNQQPHGTTTTTTTNGNKKPSNSLLDSMLRSLNQQQIQQTQDYTATKSLATSSKTIAPNDDIDDNDEEEDDVMEIQSEFVTEDMNASKSSTNNKRKR